MSKIRQTELNVSKTNDIQYDIQYDMIYNMFLKIMFSLFYTYLNGWPSEVF